MNRAKNDGYAGGAAVAVVVSQADVMSTLGMVGGVLKRPPCAPLVWFASLLALLTLSLVLWPHARPAAAPALSIVMCGQLVDDEARVHQFLLHSRHLMAGHASLRGPVEVVFVSWNTPPAIQARERRLAALLNAAVAPDVVFALYSVSPAEHRRYATQLGPDGDSVDYFEFGAKNVGLRRARGRFVLVTNVDILFSPCLVSAIADVLHSETTRAVRSSSVWRAYRSDLHAPLPPEATGDDLSAALEAANQTTHTRTSSRSIADERMLPEHALIDEASGDFMLASRESWLRTAGFPDLPFTWHMDSLQLRRFRDAGVTQRILYCRLYHRWHVTRNNIGRPRPAIMLQLLDQWSALDDIH